MTTGRVSVAWALFTPPTLPENSAPVLFRAVKAEHAARAAIAPSFSLPRRWRITIEAKRLQVFFAEFVSRRLAATPRP
jgi:hypothetical protein